MRNAIFDTDNWREIIATLSRNRTRTLLTAFGIFWGTAMLAMLWGGSYGLKGMMMRNFQSFASNLGGAFPSRTTMPYRGFQKGMMWSMTQDDLDMFRRVCPSVEYSSSLSYAMATFKYRDKSSAGQVQGVEGDYFKMQLPRLYEGRVLNSSDVTAARKTVTLGKNVADELFGAESPIGKYVEINGVYFQVTGVIGQLGEGSIGMRLDDAAVVPASTFRRTLNKGNKIDAIVFTARQGTTPSEAKPTLWCTVTSNHPVSPDDDAAMKFIDVSEQFEMVDNLFLGISLLALFVGAGTLLAGVIGVGNIMWIIVKERTREIGVRRAIGAKPRDIIAQIMAESMVLTAVSGLAGVCFAVAVLGVTDKMLYDPVLGSAHFELSPVHALAIVAAFLVLGTIAGMVPALRAMRIKPVEALNDK